MAAKPKTDKKNTQAGSAERLSGYIDRVERLVTERQALTSDIKDVYTEAKAAGFDTKAMREVVRRRAADAATLEEYIDIVNMYLAMLGQPEIGL